MRPVKTGKGVRMTFSRQKEVLEMPNLIEIQKNSYQWLLDEGLKEVFADIYPITDFAGHLILKHQMRHGRIAVMRTSGMISSFVTRRRGGKSLALILAAVVFNIGSGADAEVLNCPALGLRECVSTPGCFLDCESQEPKRCFPYRCRKAEGECESKYAQWELTKGICEAIPGCAFEPAFCFCPGPENCMCGGGPPPRCNKR